MRRRQVESRRSRSTRQCRRNQSSASAPEALQHLLLLLLAHARPALAARALPNEGPAAAKAVSRGHGTCNRRRAHTRSLATPERDSPQPHCATGLACPPGGDERLVLPQRLTDAHHSLAVVGKHDGPPAAARLQRLQNRQKPLPDARLVGEGGLLFSYSPLPRPHSLPSRHRQCSCPVPPTRA